MGDIETVQEAVIGHVLPDIGKRHRGTFGDHPARQRLGGPAARSARALSGNVLRIPQSVVKRVPAGGARSTKELKRQLEYVTRDDGVKATWMNMNGTERDLFKNTVATTIPLWASTWSGAPKRGHTDHIILSFPHGTDVEVAESIAREWGQAVFANGEFGDRWQYIAGLHQDTDHVHAHFVVNKRGVEWGQFLSISMKSELNYDIMRELHAKISTEHGVAMNASSRLSRGIIENAPRETDYRAAHAQGTTAEVEPLSTVSRMKREAMNRGFARQYKGLSGLAGLSGDQEQGAGFMGRLKSLFETASQNLDEGMTLMTSTDVDVPPVDPGTRLAEAQGRLVETAQQAWSDIQNMKPGSEKIQLEAEFAEQARSLREAAILEPFFDRHTRTLEGADDPFANLVVRGLHAARDTLLEEGRDGSGVDALFDGIREKLHQTFAQDEERLQRVGTSSAEMVERFLLSNRTEAQVAAWRDQENGAVGALYLEAERDLAKDGARIVEDYEVPRDLQEIIARDQLTQAEQDKRLSDLPAIEAIVDRLSSEMSEGDLRNVRAGYATSLKDQIKDPAVRAAVASELKNEADLAVDPASRYSEPVDQFQMLARTTPAHAKERATSRDARPDLADDYGL